MHICICMSFWTQIYINSYAPLCPCTDGIYCVCIPFCNQHRWQICQANPLFYWKQGILWHDINNWGTDYDIRCILNLSFDFPQGAWAISIQPRFPDIKNHVFKEWHMPCRALDSRPFDMVIWMTTAPVERCFNIFPWRRCITNNKGPSTPQTALKHNAKWTHMLGNSL